MYWFLVYHGEVVYLSSFVSKHSRSQAIVSAVILAFILTDCLLMTASIKPMSDQNRAINNTARLCLEFRHWWLLFVLFCPITLHRFYTIYIHLCLAVLLFCSLWSDCNLTVVRGMPLSRLESRVPKCTKIPTKLAPNWTNLELKVS